MNMQLSEQLRLLPSELYNYIFDYYNPYKKCFTQNIINTHEIWKNTWLRFLHLQTDPVIYFVMQHWLKEIGVFPLDFSDTQENQLSVFPDTCTIGYYPNKDECFIAIVQSNIPHKNMEFRVYDREQYKKWCWEECSDIQDSVTVDWNDRYWLVQ